jgi:hypothetical protein
MQTRVSPHYVMYFLLGLSGSLLFAGCGADLTTMPALSAVTAIQGRVFGGEQPITGAVIQLYAVGNSGNGSLASPLIGSTVTTGTGGTFSISPGNSPDYMCPTVANTPVYLVATGGNPGLSGTVNNTSSVLVAALGPCNGLSSSTYIVINEATTAAAAWALAQFATSYTHIGATSTNISGITNAFTVAGQLANTATGLSPNPSLPASSIVESAKLYSLADVLASCTNSDGTGSPCSGLFTAVTPSGGTTPTDTFGAALSVVKNPSNNVSGIFTNHISSTPPFPPLSSAPNDWTMTLTYPTVSGGPLYGASLQALDTQGNLWGISSYSASSGAGEYLASYTRSTLASNVSTPLNPAADGNAYTPQGFALDGSTNVWMISRTTTQGSTITNYNGSLLKFNSSGTMTSTTGGYIGSGILNPVSVATSTGGDVWIGNTGTVSNSSNMVTQNGGDAALFTSSGSGVSSSTGYAVSSTLYPGAVAVDGSGTAWFANQYPSSGAYILSIAPPAGNNPANSPTINTYALSTKLSTGIAVDTSSNVWFIARTNGTGNSNLGEISGGSLVTSSITGGGMQVAGALAIDTGNHIFVESLSQTNTKVSGTFFGLNLAEFAGAGSAGTAISPTGGYGNDTNLYLLSPTTELLDSSGNVWVNGTNYLATGPLFGTTGITLFVGLATPVTTPVLGPPQAP